MSYLVLARKWRPQTFEDVVGQEHVTRTLQNALKQDHLAHALLFSGPRGVGKTSIARILAKSMNCENGPAPVPCNECGICKEITEGASVDVLEIDGASNRGIDEIRQLRETIRFQPVRCRYRIFIIDEVHMLTKEAFNALLKTLEEPPPHVFFVFATTEPHRIPATIHSRCQHYEFRRIQITRLADHLDRIVEAEGLGLPREATLLLAREAEGSVRDSLSLLDQVAAYGARTIDDVHEALGVLGTTVMQRLALAIVSGDVQDALEVASEVYRLGVDFQKFTSDLVLFFRNVLILKKVGVDKGCTLVELDRGEAERLLDSFSEYSSNTILNILNTLMKAQSSIATSSTPRLSLELLLMQLCSLREVVAVDTLIESLKQAVEKGVIAAAAPGKPAPLGKIGDGAERVHYCKANNDPKPQPAVKEGPGREGGAQPVPRATGYNPSPVPSGLSHDAPSPDISPVESADKVKETLKKRDQKQAVKPQAVDESKDMEAGGQDAGPQDGVPLGRESWKSFADYVKKEKPYLGSVLSSIKADIDADRNAVTLYTSNGMHHDMLSDSECADILSGLGLNFFGSPVKIAVKKEYRDQSKKSSADSGDRRKQLLETPLVQEAMNVFGAKISGVQIAKGGGRRRKNR